MEHSYSVTTTGRSVMAACMAREKPLKITRVSFGSGTLPDGIPLADVHTLFEYVADGTVGDRRHEGETLILSLQYHVEAHSDIPTFYLREYMVWAENPETGQPVDLIYGNLGDYPQPVPKHRPGLPGCTIDITLSTTLSSEVSVVIEAPSGLVTYDELIRLLDNSGIGTSVHELTIPTGGWTADTDTGGQYALMRDIPMEGCTERMTPNLTILPAGMPAAIASDLSRTVKTLDGFVRVYANHPPTATIAANLALTGMLPYIRITEELPDGLPPATADTVGGIRPSSSLRVDPDGTAHVVVSDEIAATEEEAADMLTDVFDNP